MTLKLNQIEQITTLLKKRTENKDIIVLLQGDLASGKTTLVQNFVASLNIKEAVTSPTFSIQSVYGIYNKTLNEFISLGLLEEFEKKGIHFVEWGDDKLKNILLEYGFNVITIKIEKKEESREYKIES